MKYLTGRIDDITIKKGNKADGTEWTRTIFTIDTFYPEELVGKKCSLSTFDTKFMNEYKKEQLVTVEYDDITKGDVTHHNIISMNLGEKTAKEELDKKYSVQAPTPATKEKIEKIMAINKKAKEKRQNEIMFGQACNQAERVLTKAKVEIGTKLPEVFKTTEYKDLVKWFYDVNQETKKELIADGRL